MPDPLALLQARIASIGGAAPRIRARMVGELRQAVDRRFTDGRAPVDSGRLRSSIRVEEQGEQVAVRSDLPYAQRHPEILPDQAELDALVQRAADGEIERWR